MQMGADSSRTVAVQCNSRLISAELMDVPLDPLQCQQLVFQTVIPWIIGVGQREETEWSQTIVECDQYDISIQEELGTQPVTGSGAERTTMNGENDGQWPTRRHRREYVDEETIFVADIGSVQQRQLGANIAIGQCVSYIGPRLRAFRGL